MAIIKIHHIRQQISYHQPPTSAPPNTNHQTLLLLQPSMPMPKMATDSPPIDRQSWHLFMQSSAISYASPPETSSEPISKRCQHEYYWHKDLLKQWLAVDTNNTVIGPNKSQVSTIKYCNSAATSHWLSTLIIINHLTMMANATPTWQKPSGSESQYPKAHFFHYTYLRSMP